ncbi:Serine/threonine-protein kinase PRP4-like protein [Thalictrum thalictroides]|uniref:Serine/threonine-protein kinase PRP4 homolog n=1 Tax=Thalictrum thalictroides TaxID=46969 RepID=A0A7J6WIK2_THATH|nr:Serine/threonine-protein kinase PRP4-like protein [Thalictrum thalictroides]
MAGEEADIRRKHHRSSEEGIEETKKRRKHHHRHHHRHHHHRRHNREEEKDLAPIVVNNLNSLDDDKEEGEILEEENCDIAGETLKKEEDLQDNFEDLDLVLHVSKKHSELVEVERNSFENRKTSVSPESVEDKYATVNHSPYLDRYNEGGHVRKRSRSRDHERQMKFSHSYVEEDRRYQRELDATSSKEKPRGSRENARNESDLHKVLRHDKEDRHGSRDWVRDREGERSNSYSRHGWREDRHGSRNPREKERERDREMGRERENEKNRVRDRDRDRDVDKDKYRDRNKKREREDLNGYRDTRRAQHSEPGDRNSKHQSSYRNEDMENEDKLKRDESEQGHYEEDVELVLDAQDEEDISIIKEKSRKMREAILEKYRQQHQEKHGERHSEDSQMEEKDLTVGKPSKQAASGKMSFNSVSEGFATMDHGLDECDADPMFAVGKSPLRSGPVPFEKAPGAGGLGDGTPKSERSEDIFCDDIFGESPAGVRKAGKGEGLQVERNGLNDNWDDAEGYYSYRFGEVLDGRYEVTAAHGKGVFSTVVRAKDLKAGKGEPEEVAIKIIRNNDTMYKAGLEELVILKKLVSADPEDRRHCVRYVSSFKYRNHLCLVFESLHMNLREVLKKFGRNIGLKLSAVRHYAKQLFIALKHLRNCGVLHCDIKPDNMLVNEAKNVLKLCDFGNAMFAGMNEITPYLVSRFYRAPEIILGLTYDHPMDIWSVGCCLYELYSGKVLFPGPSNNDMLRLHMELKGPFPKKMLRKGAFTEQHFDHDLNFCATEEDPVTKKTVKRLLLNIKPKDISAIITGSGEDAKMLANFKDLLEKIFVLDPEKRMTVSQALNHPFITGK